jgi:hypothetical protein
MKLNIPCCLLKVKQVYIRAKGAMATRALRTARVVSKPMQYKTIRDTDSLVVTEDIWQVFSTSRTI